MRLRLGLRPRPRWGSLQRYPDGLQSFERQTIWATVNWATDQLGDNQVGDTFGQLGDTTLNKQTPVVLAHIKRVHNILINISSTLYRYITLLTLCPK